MSEQDHLDALAAASDAAFENGGGVSPELAAQMANAAEGHAVQAPIIEDDVPSPAPPVPEPEPERGERSEFDAQEYFASLNLQADQEADQEAEPEAKPVVQSEAPKVPLPPEEDPALAIQREALELQRRQFEIQEAERQRQLQLQQQQQAAALADPRLQDAQMREAGLNPEDARDQLTWAQFLQQSQLQQQLATMQARYDEQMRAMQAQYAAQQARPAVESALAEHKGLPPTLRDSVHGQVQQLVALGYDPAESTRAVLAQHQPVLEHVKKLEAELESYRGQAPRARRVASANEKNAQTASNMRGGGAKPRPVSDRDLEAAVDFFENTYLRS